MSSFALSYADHELLPRVQELVKTYHFLVEQHHLPRLHLTQEKLVLLTEEFSPMFIDFAPSLWQKRRDAGKKQGLVRACKPQPGMRIFDLTGGWGRDAAVLASFGAEVVMFERHPVMAALIADALTRLESSKMLLSLFHMDAKHYLQRLAPKDYPEVIYIDPMHPARQKSALVKKDMQILQQFLEPDPDVHELLDLALCRVRKRVVVKWPQHLPALQATESSVDGKTVRFDIFQM